MGRPVCPIKKIDEVIRQVNLTQVKSVGDLSNSKFATEIGKKDCKDTLYFKVKSLKLF